MNRYHEQQHYPTLFQLMNRKRTNQIQPSTFPGIKTTNIRNDKISNITNSSNSSSSSTFSSYSTSSSFSEKDIAKKDAATAITTAPKQTLQRRDTAFYPVETYYTVPNIRSILDRPLPSLPSTSTDNFARQQQSYNNNGYNKAITRKQQLNRHIHTGLQRAVTWLGMPFHKILTTSIELPLMYNVNQGHLQQQAVNNNSRQSLNNETDKTIYCKGILYIDMYKYNFFGYREERKEKWKDWGCVWS